MHTSIPDISGSDLANKAASGMNSLSSGTEEKLEQAADTATSMFRRLGQRGEDYLAMGNRLTESTRTCVRDHPLASVGIAVGVGILLSLLTRSSR